MESAEAKNNGGRNVNLSRHKHELYWDEGLPPYTCNGCKQFGAKKGYKCPSCAQFILHKVCANTHDEVHHNGDRLKFRSTTTLSHSCDACGEFIKGFVFESSSRDVRLHPLCTTLPETFTYSGHKEHSVKLARESESEYSCSQCGETYSGWRYGCAESGCRFMLDLNCCIIEIHDLSGITEVAVPSRRKQILRTVMNGGKALTGVVLAAGAGGVW